MAEPITILGIAGSLRRDSFNRAALRAAQSLTPADASLEVFDIRDVPLFNGDLATAPPSSVAELKARVRAADAVLFVTPEYNFSIPGVLKNAIDWGSRPPGDSAWAGKPAAIMGVSTGIFGTARAQYHLRQVLTALDMHVINKPEVMIGRAAEIFDAQGNLTDEKTITLIRKLLESLAVWTRRLRNA